nr:hypothetical protein BaRGS_030010 [Batillaria attramentaria]
MREEINYLGFVVGKDGVKPDQEKVEAIRNMPAPTTEEAEQVKEVSDNSFEISVVNSNEFTPKDFASFQPSGEPREKLDKIKLAEFDMKVEQDKDPNLVQIRKQMQQENAPKMIRKRWSTKRPARLTPTKRLLLRLKE